MAQAEDDRRLLHRRVGLVAGVEGERGEVGAAGHAAAADVGAGQAVAGGGQGHQGAGRGGVVDVAAVFGGEVDHPRSQSHTRSSSSVGAGPERQKAMALTLRAAAKVSPTTPGADPVMAK